MNAISDWGRAIADLKKLSVDLETLAKYGAPEVRPAVRLLIALFKKAGPKSEKRKNQEQG